MQPTFDLLDDQFLALSMRWDLQRQLFRHDDIEAMASLRWGGHAWHYLNRGLVDSMYIIIGRMMDPAKSGSSANLSLAYMIGKLPSGKKRDEIEDMVANIRSIYDGKIKPWRHKVIAHADLETAKNPAILPNMPFVEFDQVVEGLLAVARKLSLLVRKSDNDFRVSILPKDGAFGILDTMKRGVRARDHEIEKRKADLNAKFGPLQG